jgi:hypothetical protein
VPPSAHGLFLSLEKHLFSRQKNAIFNAPLRARWAVLRLVEVVCVPVTADQPDDAIT